MAETFDSPVLADDLEAGERWFTSDHDEPGGSQDLGHDLTVRRNTGGNNWTCWKDGTDGDKNEDSLAWNKPVYAMEDAVVERSWRNAPDTGDKNPDLGVQPGDVPTGGNHLLVRNSDGGLLLYAHFRKGTVPDELCPEDAERIQPGQVEGFAFDPGDRPTITRGQFLGRVGNSGNSSGPHLHIHRLDADGKPKALPLSRGMISDFTKSGSSECSGIADINSWARLDGDPIPQAPVLFWPPRRLTAEFTRHGNPSSSFQRMFSHLADSGFWLDWINGYSVGGNVFFNHIWKPAEGPWRAYSSLTQSEFQEKLDEADADGFDPVHLDSYLRSGSVRYAIIFHKQKPGWRIRTNRTQAQHQAIFDEAKEDGLRPVAISVVSIGGERRYSALYRKISGSWSAKTTIPESDYQTVFDENVAAGRNPVYLKTYMHEGTPFVSAIFSSNPSGLFKARHGMSSSSLQSEFDAAKQAGFRIEVITAFDGAKSQHRYFAIWRK